MAAKIEAGRLPREGSPWTGLWAVVAKEMADYLTGVRMQILEALIVLTAAGTVFAAAENLRTTVGQDRFLFLAVHRPAGPAAGLHRIPGLPGAAHRHRAGL